MRLLYILLAMTIFALGGCQTRHEVQMAPVEVKPIHITIDVNVRVQKDLEDFFGDIDNATHHVDQ